LSSDFGQTSLASGFLRSAERVPHAHAVDDGGTVTTYEALRRHAFGIAGALARSGPDDGTGLIAVLGERQAETFAAILGVLLQGEGYVPLNPRYPPSRNRELVERSGCRKLVVSKDCALAAEEILAEMTSPPRLVVAADVIDAEPIRRAADPAGHDPAYVLFTSGSTGRPKGVPVSHANVRAFLAAVAARYDLSVRDRFSQLFDLTFDLSIFDLFAAWDHGACVCTPNERHRLDPSDLVRDGELTVWFSVPSVAGLMKRFGALKADAFPSLRLSLFCGEALPAALADAWAIAAPNSVVDNLYGPTEATVACTVHRWAPNSASGANGLVPIGRPLGDTNVAVVDEELHPVPAGEPGQLLLSGPQVVSGYLDDDQATARAFVVSKAVGAYLTGDRVMEPGAGAPLEYLGRLDSQIKVLGHRVELGEVEAAIREEAGAEAVAVGWPRTETGAAGIVAFVADDSLDTLRLRRALTARLPSYMVPRELRPVAELPLNANGKRDRNALIGILEAE
jgi:amino acid adenylation domain-containing protein